MIQKLSPQFDVADLCRVFQMSRSGYYQWTHRRPSRRDQANARLLQHIRQAFAQSRQTYGSPRITQQLHRQHIPCSQNRIARLMKVHGLRAKPKCPFRPRTTDSRFVQPAPNRLKQRQPLHRLNQVWVADITYVGTRAGWAYLAAVMDLCRRRIVGWALSHSLEVSLVKEALQQALACRRPAAGLLHHSDQGSQYASSSFQRLLASHRLLPSMSAKGNCYDNAAMESFWSTLKNDLIHHRSFQDLAQARLEIFEYIEIIYNRKRLHSALGYKSPVEFELQLT